MPRYALTIAYDGTDFLGWQKQEPPASEHPDMPAFDRGDGAGPRVALRTVQHVVEQTLREVVREPVELTGASRTDSGVHAGGVLRPISDICASEHLQSGHLVCFGQLASFVSEPDPARGVGWPSDRPLDKLVRALNGRLPRDVLVRDAHPVPDAFNPIRAAREKEYTYAIAWGEPRPLWDRRFVFHTMYDLDPAPMIEAAARLVGRHDFAGFAQSHHGRKTTVRTVTSCAVETGPSAGGDKRLIIRVRGDGFLYNMVRIIAGTLMEVGRTKLTPEDIDRMLVEADRTKNPAPTLPPQGLRLEWVRYEV